jgi:hypothetical protein
MVDKIVDRGNGPEVIKMTDEEVVELELSRTPTVQPEKTVDEKFDLFLSRSGLTAAELKTKLLLA